ANVLLTATELKRRGHTVGLLHGTNPGRPDSAWEEAFDNRYPVVSALPTAILRFAVGDFHPDVIFLHNLADMEVLAGLVECGVPVVRMVHDHQLSCLRGYKYNPLNRHICTRAASPYCVFPCMATVARNSAGPLPIKLTSFRQKLREIALNRRFQRLIVATDY